MLLPKRGTSHSSENTSDRIVTGFLTEMDGLLTKSRSKGAHIDLLVVAGKIVLVCVCVVSMTCYSCWSSYKSNRRHWSCCTQTRSFWRAHLYTITRRQGEFSVSSLGIRHCFTYAIVAATVTNHPRYQFQNANWLEPAGIGWSAKEDIELVR